MSSHERWARGRAARSRQLLGASGSFATTHLLSAKELAGSYGVSSSIFNGDLETTERLPRGALGGPRLMQQLFFFYHSGANCSLHLESRGGAALNTSPFPLTPGVHAACKMRGALQNPEPVLCRELFPRDGTRTVVAASQTWGCFCPLGCSHPGLGTKLPLSQRVLGVFCTHRYRRNPSVSVVQIWADHAEMDRWCWGRCAAARRAGGLGKTWGCVARSCGLRPGSSPGAACGSRAEITG